MIRYLLDTNILSELRKGSRADAGVRQWFESAAAEEKFISVLTLGEIRSGIERIRMRDSASAVALDRWLELILAEYPKNILPVDEAVADCWGCFPADRPVPVLDGLLAATAMVHGLVLVTRNGRDVESTGVRFLNPFTKARN